MELHSVSKSSSILPWRSSRRRRAAPRSSGRLAAYIITSPFTEATRGFARSVTSTSTTASRLRRASSRARDAPRAPSPPSLELRVGVIPEGRLVLEGRDLVEGPHALQDAVLDHIPGHFFGVGTGIDQPPPGLVCRGRRARENRHEGEEQHEIPAQSEPSNEFASDALRCSRISRHGKCEPRQHERHVEDEEGFGRQGQPLNSHQDRGRRQAVTHPHIEGIDCRLCRETSSPSSPAARARGARCC